MGNANSGVWASFINSLISFFKCNKGGIKMPKKLTQEEFVQRVYNCVGDLYQVISEYQGKTKPVMFKCTKHNFEF